MVPSHAVPVLGTRCVRQCRWPFSDRVPAVFQTLWWGAPRACLIILPARHPHSVFGGRTSLRGHAGRRAECGLTCYGVGRRPSLRWRDGREFEVRPFACYGRRRVCRPGSDGLPKDQGRPPCPAEPYSRSRGREDPAVDQRRGPDSPAVGFRPVFGPRRMLRGPPRLPGKRRLLQPRMTGKNSPCVPYVIFGYQSVLCEPAGLIGLQNL